MVDEIEACVDVELLEHEAVLEALLGHFEQMKRRSARTTPPLRRRVTSSVRF